MVEKASKMITICDKKILSEHKTMFWERMVVKTIKN
jgi:hypothetical protein